LEGGRIVIKPMHLGRFHALVAVLFLCQSCAGKTGSMDAGPTADPAHPTADADPHDGSGASPDAASGPVAGYGTVCSRADLTQGDCPPGMGLVCLPVPDGTGRRGICTIRCGDGSLPPIAGDPLCQGSYSLAQGRPTCGYATLGSTYYCAIRCPDMRCPSGLQCKVPTGLPEGFCEP
jgi:hypothetical protein